MGTVRHMYRGQIVGGGGGVDTGIELTQAEYDALGSEKYTNNVTYYIKDGVGGVGSDNLVASNGTPFKFGYNENTGEYGYIVTDEAGADTFCPFSNATKLYEALQYSGLVTEDMTFDEMCEALAITYPEIPIGTAYSFAYTGTIQEFEIPLTGLYKLEVYGAKGGGGGAGGYSRGYIQLQKGTLVYIGVGSTGTSSGTGGYNGGGGGLNSSNPYGGGGATHIALVNGTLSSIGYQKFVTDKMGLIVAGGGGGYSSSATGGGLTGGGTGGTQTSGAAFGVGSAGSTGYHDEDGQWHWKTVGAGGGGLYGGGQQGGGSGYIGGVPEITYRGLTYYPETTNGKNTAANGSAIITLTAI